MTIKNKALDAKTPKQNAQSPNFDVNFDLNFSKKGRTFAAWFVIPNS